MKHPFFSVLIVAILVAMLFSPSSASTFNFVGANAILTTMQLKTINTITGNVSSNAVLGNDTKNSIIGATAVKLTNLGKSDDSVIQTYPASTILISDDFAGNTNIMQISKDPTYPLLEVYYGYDKSVLESWQHYFRIEEIDKNNAYVIYGDFDKKSVWIDSIPRSTYDTIISSGAIPDWKTINVGG